MSDFSLITILVEVLKEVGDLKNIEPFERNGNSFKFAYKGNTHIGKVNISPLREDISKLKFPDVIRNKDKKTIMNVGYNIDGTDSQMLQSDYNILIRILKTVVEILLENLNDNCIYVITGKSKIEQIGVADKQKLLLYAKILQNNLDSSWRFGKVTFNDEINGNKFELAGMFFCKK